MAQVPERIGNFRRLPVLSRAPRILSLSITYSNYAIDFRGVLGRFGGVTAAGSLLLFFIGPPRHPSRARSGRGGGNSNWRPAAHSALRHLWVRQVDTRARAELLAMRDDRIHEQRDAPPLSTLKLARASLFAPEIDVAKTL